MRPIVDDLEQQVRVSKTLGMAFVLSITGIFGVGSLIALILGYKALGLFRVPTEESTAAW